MTIGIAELSAKAKELELLGKNNDTGQINEKLPEFLAEYKQLKQALLKALEEK